MVKNYFRLTLVYMISSKHYNRHTPFLGKKPLEASAFYAAACTQGF